MRKFFFKKSINQVLILYNLLMNGIVEGSYYIEPLVSDDLIFDMWQSTWKIMVGVEITITSDASSRILYSV